MNHGSVLPGEASRSDSSQTRARLVPVGLGNQADNFRSPPFSQPTIVMGAVPGRRWRKRPFFSANYDLSLRHSNTQGPVYGPICLHDLITFLYPPVPPLDLLALPLGSFSAPYLPALPRMPPPARPAREAPPTIEHLCSLLSSLRLSPSLPDSTIDELCSLTSSWRVSPASPDSTSYALSSSGVLPALPDSTSDVLCSSGVSPLPLLDHTPSSCSAMGGPLAAGVGLTPTSTVPDHPNPPDVVAAAVDHIATAAPAAAVKTGLEHHQQMPQREEAVTREGGRLSPAATSSSNCCEPEASQDTPAQNPASAA
ncbi:hypothetical protein HaLaN_00736 [Haematococcus lacustris]|uniref:Uncharacterized protein n=1 Tax=Haematococcus lacustris TaxID=44745 RepID=A0A699Y9Y2_HAELA|nr:hypothetical protein HaLaN_00736 [Haematococcus lacustris]